MANGKGKPQTQIEVLKDHYRELTALGDAADEAATRLRQGNADVHSEEHHTADRLEAFQRECLTRQERVVFFMSLFEPEGPTDTLVMAIMAATLLNLSNTSEGPGVQEDRELAEEFAWKAIRGIERLAGLTTAEIGLDGCPIGPFGERAGEVRRQQAKQVEARHG